MSISELCQAKAKGRAKPQEAPLAVCRLWLMLPHCFLVRCSWWSYAIINPLTSICQEEEEEKPRAKAKAKAAGRAKEEELWEVWIGLDGLFCIKQYKKATMLMALHCSICLQTWAGRSQKPKPKGRPRLGQVQLWDKRQWVKIVLSIDPQILSFWVLLQLNKAFFGSNRFEPIHNWGKVYWGRAGSHGSKHVPQIISWKTQHHYNSRSYKDRLYFCQAKPQVQSDAVEGPSLKAGKLERFRSSEVSRGQQLVNPSLQIRLFSAKDDPTCSSNSKVRCLQCEVCSHRVVLTLKNLHGAPKSHFSCVSGHHASWRGNILGRW